MDEEQKKYKKRYYKQQKWQEKLNLFCTVEERLAMDRTLIIILFVIVAFLLIFQQLDHELLIKMAKAMIRLHGG